MYTNLYLVEKLDSAHRADMLQEAAHDRQSAQFPRASAQLAWRVVGKLGTLLVQVGTWLERGAASAGLRVAAHPMVKRG